jgi:hypothetical protein
MRHDDERSGGGEYDRVTVELAARHRLYRQDAGRPLRFSMMTG